jgi:adenylate cyclase
LALTAVVTVIVVAITVTLWNTYFRSPSVEVASVEKMAYPLPDKPSIAVLPFANMSDDPKQEFFSDGITEHIITSLSKVPYIFVIARNSTFSYKNKSVKVQQIAEGLGVQYVLEGSVQRSDDRVRITAQLIDAIAGHHIWAENYDREVRDIFSLQDEIAMKIMAEMQVKLTVKELGRLSAIKTKNIKAYEKYLMGYDYFWRRTEGDTQQARKHAQEAISLDSEYGAPYILLARTYLDDVWYYKTKPAAESLETVERLVQKSIELSGQDSIAYQILGSVYSLRRQYDKAIAECQKAIDLSPNSAEANYFYGKSLRWAGRFDEAIHFFKKAIRLNPITPMSYLNNIAWAYGFSEQYEKAISIWNKAIERNPDYFFAYLGLTLVYQLSGNELKAREAAAEVMRLKPNLTISKLEKGPATKNIDRKRMFEALRKAGIPE